MLKHGVTARKLIDLLGKAMVAEEGLEPPTRGLWFRCSNQLSYSAIRYEATFLYLIRFALTWHTSLGWHSPRFSLLGRSHSVRSFTGFAALRSSGYLAFRQESLISGIHRSFALLQRLLANPVTNLTLFHFRLIRFFFISPAWFFRYSSTCDAPQKSPCKCAYHPAPKSAKPTRR